MQRLARCLRLLRIPFCSTLFLMYFASSFTFADEAENKTTPGFKQVPAIPVHGAAGGGSAAEGGKAAAGKGTRAGQGKHDADGRRGGVGWGSVEREPAPKPTTEEPRTPQPRAESASPCRYTKMNESHRVKPQLRVFLAYSSVFVF